MRWTLEPIGTCRTPFADKASAPRQPAAARGVRGRIELDDRAELRDALFGLEEWSHLWIIYVFDRDPHFSPKVQPPRAAAKKGVLATRSPHRPNPIGLSLVRLERVERCTLHVIDVDMVDRTPVLDVKPYVAYADTAPDATDGWLAREDPRPAWQVRWSALAEAQRQFLEEQGVDLGARAEQALSLGPEPHAYRRIRVEASGERVLSIKAWRVRFRAEDGARIEILRIDSGYRPADLAEDAPELAPHRALRARFP
jgi:tRNA-Thr(GGU) m(6)t(6)A37 methyltransferase TsaA